MRLTNSLKCLLILVALSLTILFSADASAQNTLPQTTVQVTDEVILPSAKRFGMNVGFYDQFGAAQYLKNMVPNPGFEGGEVASIFIADAGATNNRIRAQGWSARPVNGVDVTNYWRGGQLEYLTGKWKGLVTQIVDVSTEGGGYTFITSGGAAPARGDIIAVRGNPIPGYFMTNRNARLAFDTTTTRPNSFGSQSLRITPIGEWETPSFLVAFDSQARDGDRTAGKMRVVEGNYKVSFWAKAEQPNTMIEFVFKRDHSYVFYKTNIPLTGQWQRIDRNMYIPPGADNPWLTNALIATVRIVRGDGSVWLDDMSIEKAGQTNPSPFDDEFVQVLKELNPGILRDWGHQFGSSLDNQLADQFARRSTGISPHKVPGQWHYSVSDFLRLAEQVGSEPWYTMPPTWSSLEIENFIAYLAAPLGTHPYANLRASHGQRAPWTTVFNKIHLEYGNEMWMFNKDFQTGLGQAMGSPVGAADAASNRFNIIRNSTHFTPWKFNLIVGGQVNYPDLQGQLENRLTNSDMIALAPYYGELFDYANDEQLFMPLYAGPRQDVSAGGRVFQTRESFNKWTGRNAELAIYEVNLQLTRQGAPLNIRNDWYTSQGAGIALPLHMLTYQRDMGINTQVAFTALQYSNPVSGQQWHRVWGLLRDLHGTGNKRPAWLGLEMANMAIHGNMVRTVQGGDNPHWTQQPMNGINRPINVPYVQSFAYRSWGNSTAVVLFNLHTKEEQQVNLQLPLSVSPQGNAQIHTLASNYIRDDNETRENVKIETTQRYLGRWSTVTLPPHSMTVVRWR